jgi:tetratricopeptide (TPR) repeat protein
MKGLLDKVYTIALVFLAFIIFKPSVTLKILIISVGVLIYLYINIFLHEIGHYLAAKLVGFKVLALNVGSGKEFYRKKWKEVLVTASLGVSGYTSVRVLDRKNLRLRMMVFSAAGILVNGLILFLLCLITGFNIKSGSNGVVTIFVVVSILLLLITIKPSTVIINGMNVPNDGKRILTLPFMKEEELDKFVSSQEQIDTFRLLQNKEYALAAKVFEELMQKQDVPEGVIINYAHCLANSNRHNEAKNQLLQLFEKEHSRDYDSLITNNLAWYFLMDFCDDSINMADKFSAEAIKLDSLKGTIINTRGCVLIEMGDVETGVKMLKESLSMNKTRGKEGEYFADYAFLAYGYYKIGNTTEMNKCLQYLNTHRNKVDQDIAVLYEKLMARTNGFQSL